MENNEVETEKTQTEEESNNTPEEADTSEKTQEEAEPSLTKEQKSKLDSFDRIYAENKELKKFKAENTSKDTSGSSENAKEEAKEEWVTPNDPIEVAKLGKVIGKYSDEETEFILRNAPSKDLAGIIKAEQDPMVQSAIQAQREKVEKEKQTPEPSTRQTPSEKPFKQVTTEDLKKMSIEEKEEYFKKLGWVRR